MLPRTNMPETGDGIKPAGTPWGTNIEAGAIPQATPEITATPQMPELNPAATGAQAAEAVAAAGAKDPGEAVRDLAGENPQPPQADQAAPADTDSRTTGAKTESGSGQAAQTFTEQDDVVHTEESLNRNQDAKDKTTTESTDSKIDEDVKTLNSYLGIHKDHLTESGKKTVEELKAKPGVYKKFLEGKSNRTPDEQRDLDKLNRSKETDGLTEQQKAEKFKTDIDNLGNELHNKIVDGEDLTDEDLQKLKDLNDLHSELSGGFTSEQTKDALRRAITDSKPLLKDWFSNRNKELTDSIQELLKIEFQIMSMPRSLRGLRTQRETLQTQADGFHKDAEDASDQSRLNLKTKEYDTYMKIANINSQIMNAKYGVVILQAKQQDLEQFVRRKTGTTSGLGALKEFTGAKASRAAAEIQVMATEASDYAFGFENRDTRMMGNN